MADPKPCFPLDTLIEWDYPIAGVSPTGIVAINQLLVQSGLPPLPPDESEDWTWAWKTRRGTLPKRARAWFRKTFDLKLDPTLYTLIGNIARENALDHEHLVFDFTCHFDWQAGAYGDSGSCFWGTYSWARTLLEQRGAYAVRFYLPDTCRGYARAWMMPVPDTDPSQFALFNAYGRSLIWIARVVLSYLGLSYQPVRIQPSQKHPNYNYIYINRDGLGYLLGPPDEIAMVHQVLLPLHNPARCFRCQANIDSEFYVTSYNETICESCFMEYYTYCDDCDEVIPMDELIYTGHDTSICPACYRSYIECDTCGELFREHAISIVQTGPHKGRYCPDCYRLIRLTAAA